MSRFKIGQRVVAVINHSDDSFIKGREYIVDGFSCCDNCGRPYICLRGFNEIVRTQDFKGCNHLNNPRRQSYYENAFAPLSNIADAVEYRLSVSIPELTEVKIEQLQ